MGLTTFYYSTLIIASLASKAFGAPDMPGYLELLPEVGHRLAKKIRSTDRLHEILHRSLPEELTETDPGDIEAADQAVAAVIASVDRSRLLTTAARSQPKLERCLASERDRKRKELGSEKAQAIFDWRLSEIISFLVRTAPKNREVSAVIQAETLRSIDELRGELDELLQEIRKIPAETIRLLAGQALELQPELASTGPEIAPSRLLSPTAGVIPFLDPPGRLKALLEWADHADSFKVHIIGGSGGTGKSRLAVELCRKLLGSPGISWVAGFLNSDDLDTKLASLVTTPRPRLVILDYAETRTADIAKVFGRLGPSASYLTPVRVLLLVRNPASQASGSSEARWREAVRPYRDEAIAQIIDQATITVLGEEKLALAARAELFRNAAKNFADRLGKATPAHRSDLSFLVGDGFDRPLEIAMAAYLDVYGELDPTRHREHLFEDLLEHEAQYWQQVARHSEIELDLNSIEQRSVMALATLLDISDKAETRKLLALLPAITDDRLAGRAIEWLKTLYPSGSTTLWGHLTPDRLAEYLVAQGLAKEPDILTAVLTAAPVTEFWHRPLQILARACKDYDELAATVGAILNQHLNSWVASIAEFIVSTHITDAVPWIEALSELISNVALHCDVNVLRRAGHLIDQKNVLTFPLQYALLSTVLERNHLANAHIKATDFKALSLASASLGRSREALTSSKRALELFQTLMETNPNRYRPHLADSLNNHASRLAALGQKEEALRYSHKALTLYQDLAHFNPARYNPELAGSFNNHANRLADLGHKEKALHYSHKALTLYQQLAQTNSTPYEPNLAVLLSNHASLLADLGQQKEALRYSHKALTLYQDLAHFNPARYNPELASFFNNYANLLADLDQKQEALRYSKKALGICRNLAHFNPTRYNPKLAVVLTNHANKLAALDRAEEALRYSHEALVLCQELARFNPKLYAPGLADSLDNYAIRLADLGHKEKALNYSHQALALYQEISQANPILYNPDYAICLNNYAVRLANLDRYECAVTHSRKACVIYQKLTETNPTLYTPKFAVSLNYHALLLTRLCHHQKALAYSKQALTLYQQLAQANPARYTPNRADTLRLHADLLTKLNRYEEAQRVEEELARLLEEMDDTGDQPQS